MSAIFITVSYNNLNATLKYIQSWKALEGIHNSFLIVVDNSHVKDKELERNLKKETNIFYIRQDENKGYMAGCNYGFSYIKDLVNISPSFIVYSNNDITFESKDFIEKATGLFNNNSEVAFIAPSVWDLNEQKELNPFMISRPSAKRFKIMKAIFSNYYLALLFDIFSRYRPRKKSKVITEESKVYAPHGSIFIIEFSFLKNNPIDDAYFLYGEEITVGETALSAKKEIKYNSSIKIFHHSHSTTGVGLSIFTYKSKKNAINYLINKYFNKKG